MNRRIIHSTSFVRAMRRFLKKHGDMTSVVRSSLALLATDAFDARLKTHKLTGNLTGTWACSAGHDLRILFEFVKFEGEEAILLLNIGSHDEVY